MATSKWRKEQIWQYGFYLHKERDKEILEYFRSKPNKREYLLKLIADEKKKSATH